MNYVSQIVKYDLQPITLNKNAKHYKQPKYL